MQNSTQTEKKEQFIVKYLNVRRRCRSVWRIVMSHDV